MRVLGYVLGLLLMADGTLAAVTPRWWTDVELPLVSRLVTKEEARAMEEFRRVPAPTLRSWGLWESVFGLMIVALASRIPDRAAS